jgi:hypothetical protein
MTAMKNLIDLLDPETYGLNRTAVVFGVIALGVMTLIGLKLLAVLREAGLPS